VCGLIGAYNDIEATVPNGIVHDAAVLTNA